MIPNGLSRSLLEVSHEGSHFPLVRGHHPSQAVIAGSTAHIPVMIGSGAKRKERPRGDRLMTSLRPGDTDTHMHSARRGERNPATRGPSQAMLHGRKRGIWFDVRHGGGTSEPGHTGQH